MLQKKGQINEAIGHYLAALKINPDYEEAHYNLGLVLQGQGQTEDAIDHYNEAIRLKPDFVQARNNLAIALFKNGDLNGAAYLGRLSESTLTIPSQEKISSRC